MVLAASKLFWLCMMQLFCFEAIALLLTIDLDSDNRILKKIILEVLSIMAYHDDQCYSSFLNALYLYKVSAWGCGHGKASERGLHHDVTLYMWSC